MHHILGLPNGRPSSARIAAALKEEQMMQPDFNATLRLERPDGGWLQYAVAGDGDPVVFIHGFGLDFGMWDPQWQPFSARYRAIRYDLRGYGGSSLPDGPYFPVGDPLAVIARLDPPPVHLVCLSLRGAVALLRAIQDPHTAPSLSRVDAALCTPT